MARRKAAPKRRRTYRRRTTRKRSSPEKSIGLGDIAVGAFAMERFGVFDVIEEGLDIVGGILGGQELDVVGMGRRLVRPIRERATLQNALQVGAAGGVVGILRRFIPGSGKAIGKVPSGVPLLGGYKIKRF